MKPATRELRDALAAEYALGTLRGRARRRFERWLSADAALQRSVEAWQERLIALDEGLPPMQPPHRVWAGVEARIGGTGEARHGGLWHSLGFWRGATFASTVASLGLLGLLSFTGTVTPRETMVVVMQDQHNQPRITVSWGADDRGRKQMRVRVLGHATMSPDTAWELWMLPQDDAKPVSLGLITTHETQELVVPPELTHAVNAAKGLAMSVEPAGGSPTGLPTGPVLYQGQCVKL